MEVMGKSTRVLIKDAVTFVLNLVPKSLDAIPTSMMKAKEIPPKKLRLRLITELLKKLLPQTVSDVVNEGVESDIHDLVEKRLDDTEKSVLDLVAKMKDALDTAATAKPATAKDKEGKSPGKGKEKEKKSTGERGSRTDKDDEAAGSEDEEVVDEVDMSTSGSDEDNEKARLSKESGLALAKKKHDGPGTGKRMAEAVVGFQKDGDVFKADSTKRRKQEKVQRYRLKQELKKDAEEEEKKGTTKNEISRKKDEKLRELAKEKETKKVVAVIQNAVMERKALRNPVTMYNVSAGWANVSSKYKYSGDIGLRVGKGAVYATRDIKADEEIHLTFDGDCSQRTRQEVKLTMTIQFEDHDPMEYFVYPQPVRFANGHAVAWFVRTNECDKAQFEFVWTVQEILARSAEDAKTYPKPSDAVKAHCQRTGQGKALVRVCMLKKKKGVKISAGEEAFRPSDRVIEI
jgi:hypothetical protein